MAVAAVLLPRLVSSGHDEGAIAIARPPETLVIGRPADSTTLDPAATTRMADFIPIYLAYERLVEPVVENGHPTGALRSSLAESWRVSDDQRRWQFTITAGHRFSDGTPVDAAAVARSFARLEAVARGPAQILEMVDRVEADDGRTVTFHLRRPFPALAQLLTLPMFSIVGPAAQAHSAGGDHGASWLADHSLGSGSYRVSRWDRGQRLWLEANPHASRRPVHFSSIRLDVIGDRVSRLAQLRRGDIDIAASTSPEMASRLADIPGVLLRSGPGAILYYLEMNNARPPFSNSRMRRAVSLAVDRPAIIRGIFGGYARQVRGLLPEGMRAQDGSIPPPLFDLEAARRELTAAGYSQSGALRLSYSPTDPALDALAVAIQANLIAAGIRVRIESLSPSAYNEKVRFAGDFDLALRAYAADFPDPWIILDPLYSSANSGPAGNVSRYAHRDVDTLLRAAGTVGEPGRRIALYREAQRRIARDDPHAVLLAADGLVAYRDDIVGITPNFWQPDLLDVAALRRRPRPPRAGAPR